MSTDRHIRKLAQDLAQLRSQVHALSTQPQLGFSSIEAGVLTTYDDDDSIRAYFGLLADGTYGHLPVNGEPPPVPSVPLLTSTPRGFIVRWDGNNEDGSDVQPLDWNRCAIHVSTAGTEFTPSPSTLKHTIETPAGGSFSFVAGAEYDPLITGDYAVKLVAISTSGMSSSPSQVATIRLGKVETFDIAPFAVQITQLHSTKHFLY